MSLRLERVRELLKRELGEIIRREIPMTEAGLINVNEVGVAADLKSATVFVGVVGTAEQRRRAATLLEKEGKRIQGLIGRAVVLKYTPHLKFVIDESIERGNRVLEILDELEKSTPPHSAEPSSDSTKPVPNEGSSQDR
ncbi:MAG TPA: 30S ribosome-binding factor RbfA [Candidatus Kapabacteria bacterium]|jgi:ribosome-binding factor A|nr:30S ribosome-binding factor RbfA [Candidatus Kapabacteria bacterium]